MCCPLLPASPPVPERTQYHPGCGPERNDFVVTGIWEFLEGGEFAHIWCPHCETSQHVDLPASAWTIEAERNRAWGRETPMQAAVTEAAEEDFWLEEFRILGEEIEAKQAVIEHLRAVVLTQNDKNVELSERLSYIVGRARNHAQDAQWRIENIIDAISDTGTHAERSMSILGAIRGLIEINRTMRHELDKVQHAAEKGVPKKTDFDEIPF